MHLNVSNPKSKSDTNFQMYFFNFDFAEVNNSIQKFHIILNLFQIIAKLSSSRLVQPSSAELRLALILVITPTPTHPCEK